jgi:glycosyltransferase involved in cell wall biosynthesis
MQPYKGFHVLLDAVRRLRQQGREDVVLALCGEGPQLPELREQARPLGEQVRFLGRRDDVPQLLGGATIAVVPSLWEEAFGLAVAEGMAAGVPVVASRIGGIPEQVEDGQSGLLVPPGDADALAGALLRLLSDPEERTRLAAQGRERARNHFSIERTVAALHRVLLAHLEPVPAPAVLAGAAG